MTTRKVYIGLGIFFLLLAIIVGGLLLWRVHQRKHTHYTHGQKSVWPTKDLMEGEPFDTKFDGIDISEHQGRIHWELLGRNQRCPKFVYVRIMGKEKKIDPEYESIAENVHKKGIPFGSYFFYSHDYSINEQFNLFLEKFNSTKQELRPVIDIEDESISRGTSEHLKDSVLLLAKLIEEKCRVKPIIYSNQNFYETYLAPTFNSYPLWIANYSRCPDIQGVRPVLWQYSDKGRVKGFWTKVDLDIFINGNTLKDILL